MARPPSLQRKPRRRLLRRLVGAAGMLLVLALAGLALGARHVLPPALERVAALRGVPLSVGGAEVAWVDGRVTLFDLGLGGPVAPLAWESVELDWEWKKLLTGRLELERVQLRGTRLDLSALSAPGGGVDTLATWLATLDGLELERTPLPWLEAALGAEAAIERAHCQSLARLAAGEAGECQLALRVGDAPVRLAIELRIDGESLRYDSRLDADALELERWQALIAPEQAHPLARAHADVRARVVGSYEPREALLDASGDLTLSVAELSGTAPGATFEAGDIVWRGSLDAGWSSSLGLVVARARGELEVARMALSAESSDPAAAFRLDTEGVRWRGGVDLVGDAPVLEGALQTERATLAPASGQWQAEVAGLGARGGLSGTSPNLDSIAVRTIEIGGPTFGAAGGFVLEGLALEGVSQSDGTWRAARLTTRSLVSTGTLSGPGGEEHVARVPALAAVGVTLAADGRFEALRFEAPRVELRVGVVDAVLDRVTAQGVVAGPLDGLTAERLSAERLEEVDAQRRIVYEELLAEPIELSPEGAGAVGESRVARVTIDFEDAGRWTLDDFRAHALRWTAAGASSIDEVSVRVLGFAGGPTQVRGTLDSLVVRSFTASADVRLTAEEAHAAAIALSSSRVGSWRARELRLTGPRLDPGERLQTRRIQLDELAARGVAGFDWTLEGLAIDGLDGTALTRFDAGALAFASTRFASASLDSQLDGFDARGVRWRPGARLMVEQGSLEQSTIRTEERAVFGTRYRATEGTWVLPLDFEAATVRLESLAGVEPGGLEWEVQQLDTQGFSFEELPSYGAFAAGAARGAALTIEVPPTASARFDAPEFEELRWVLGELPAFASARVGVIEGRAEPVQWRIGSTMVSGSGADRDFESIVVRDMTLLDTEQQAELAADALRLADGKVPRWPIFEAAAFEIDGLRASKVDGQGLGRLLVDWTRGTDGRVALGESVELGEVMLTDLDVWGGVDEQGRRVWPVLDPRQVGLRPSRVRVARLATEGPASISYVDYSVTPPVELELEPINAVLRGFDTARPDRPGEFEIRAVGANEGSFAARGLITPSFDTLDVDAEVSARGLDLTKVSPWATRLHGTRITSGRMDLDVDVRVEARTVSGNAKMLIDSLDLAPPEREGRPATFGQEARRFQGSLALLEDGNRRIRLQAPFSGNLDDKQFRFSRVLGQAIANTATTTVMLAFKPIGLVVGEVFRGSRFPPLDFEPGEVSLSATDLVLLEDLARSLEERPRMQIQLCGKAGPSDREAIERSLSQPGRLPVVLGGAGVTPSFTARDLARRRAESARGWLLRTGRVQADQLPLCEPTVEQDPAALPRVEVVLAYAPPERPAPPPSRERREELAR